MNIFNMIGVTIILSLILGTGWLGFVVGAGDFTPDRSLAILFSLVITVFLCLGIWLTNVQIYIQPMDDTEDEFDDDND